jgi:hypothetical protein
MISRLNPGKKSGDSSVLSHANPAGRVGELRELQNLATFLMAPNMCDWLSGESIMMDGANALATGGNFYALTGSTDQDCVNARTEIENHNRKGKLDRANPASED